jgi:hypothetical protein
MSRNAAVLGSWLAGCALCALLMTGVAQVGFAQNADGEPGTLSFEVASVRENVSGPGGGWYEVRPGGLLIRNYELQLLIATIQLFRRA